MARSECSNSDARSPTSRVDSGLGLFRFDNRALEERHDLVEHRLVAGSIDVHSHGVGQPQQIVRAPCARTAPSRRMPPVLDVAFHELSRRCSQQVLATEMGLA